MKPTDPMPSSDEETITTAASIADTVESTAPLVAAHISPVALPSPTVPPRATPRIVTGVSLAPNVRLRHYYRWRGWVAPKLF